MGSQEPEVLEETELDADLLDHASTLEQLVQQVLVAEQSVFAKEVSRFGLTVPQFVTLSAISCFPDDRVRMGRIAQAAHQCSATMTGIIDRLRNLGLVERAHTEDDRRTVLVFLTDAGRSKVAAVRAARQQRLARLIINIDPEMRARMNDVLTQYAQELDAIC